MKLRFEVRDTAGRPFARCAAEHDAFQIASRVKGRTVWFLTKCQDARATTAARQIGREGAK